MNNLQQKVDKITDFNNARGWNPACVDSAKSIVIEAAELLEHFQWDESSKDLAVKKEKEKDWEKIKKEVADVFWYLVTFCNKANIDLSDAIQLKIVHNEEKYPEEMFKGQHNSKFYLDQKRKYRELKKN